MRRNLECHCGIKVLFPRFQNRQQYELIENPNYVPGGLLPEVERHPITVGFMKNIGNQHEVRVSVPNMELSSIMRAISVATNIVK